MKSTRGCATTTAIYLRSCCRLPKLKLCARYTPAPHSPALAPAPAALLSLWVWLFEAPPVSGIARCFPLCDWLPSGSVSPRLGHAGVCRNCLPPQGWVAFLHALGHFCSSTHRSTDTVSDFTLRLLWITLLWARVYKNAFQALLSRLRGRHPEVELLEHTVTCFRILRNRCTVFRSGWISYLLTSSTQGSNVSTFPSTLILFHFVLFLSFLIVIIIGTKVLLMGALIRISLRTGNIEHLLMCYCPFVHFLRRNIYLSSLPNFIWLFFLLSCKSFLYF